MPAVMKERGAQVVLRREEQPALTLEFCSHAHLAMGKSTLGRTMRRVEDTRVRPGAFKLPGRKRLREAMRFEVAAESPILLLSARQRGKADSTTSRSTGVQGSSYAYQRNRQPHNKSKPGLAGERIPIEHVIRRRRVFRILKDTYRHRRRRFGLRLHLLAGLYDADLLLPKTL